MADFKLEPHAPDKLGGISWPVCKKCGLIFLRNEFTAWCVKQGCNCSEHPGYQQQREKVGKTL